MPIIVCLNGFEVLPAFGKPSSFAIFGADATAAIGASAGSIGSDESPAIVLEAKGDGPRGVELGNEGPIAIPGSVAGGEGIGTIAESSPTSGSVVSSANADDLRGAASACLGANRFSVRPNKVFLRTATRAEAASPGAKGAAVMPETISGGWGARIEDESISGEFASTEG